MEHLSANNLYSYYGKSPILQGVTFDLKPGEFLSVLGRNGVGKTTLLKSIIKDELGVLIKRSANDWIVMSLSRGTRQARFTPGDVERINTIHKTLTAAVIRNWCLNGATEIHDVEGHAEDRLLSFGADRLSPREAEVVRLTLQGHSAGSASAFLGITEGTVKVHRHNAYSKLGVSSQAELFSAATRYLAAKQV